MGVYNFEKDHMVFQGNRKTSRDLQSIKSKEAAVEYYRALGGSGTTKNLRLPSPPPPRLGDK